MRWDRLRARHPVQGSDCVRGRALAFTLTCPWTSQGANPTRTGWIPSSQPWVWPIGSITSRASSPAVNNSGWPARGPWPAGDHLRRRTRLQPGLGGRWRGAGFLARSVREFHQTVVLVPHDPVAAGYADRVLFLADGRIVDEMSEPHRRAGAGPDEELRACRAGELTCSVRRSRVSWRTSFGWP